MSRLLPEPVTPDPRQPVPEGGEIETRLNIPLTAEELDWVEHAARLRHLPVVEYVRRAINLSLTKEGVDAVLLSESEDEYSEVEQDCRGCMGPCGRCHEQAQRQDSSSVQEGAVEVCKCGRRECGVCWPHACTACGGFGGHHVGCHGSGASEVEGIIAQIVEGFRFSDRHDQIEADLRTLVAAAVRPSSPRSQPVTAKTALHEAAKWAAEVLSGHVDMCSPDCTCKDCPQCGKDPHDCTGTDCSRTCQCSYCDHCEAEGAINAIASALQSAQPVTSASIEDWMVRRLEVLQAQYRADANNHQLGSFRQSEALAFAVSLEHALITAVRQESTS